MKGSFALRFVLITMGLKEIDYEELWRLELDFRILFSLISVLHIRVLLHMSFF